MSAKQIHDKWNDLTDQNYYLRTKDKRILHLQTLVVNYSMLSTGNICIFFQTHCVSGIYPLDHAISLLFHFTNMSRDMFQPMMYSENIIIYLYVFIQLLIICWVIHSRLIIPSALRPQLFPVLTMEKNLKEKQCIFAGPVAMSFCGWSLQELAVSWTLATFEYTRKTLLTNSNHLFKGANIKIFIVAWYSLSLLLQHRWHCEGWTTSNRAEFLFNL